MLVAYRRASENMPGSHPAEMTATLPPSRAAASTRAKCSGIFACVSNESTTLNKDAHAGVCSGRSLALPPQSTSTSMSPACAARSSAECTATPSVSGLTLEGSRRVNTAASSMSSF